MNQNVWEFIRNEDGTFAVLHNGKRMCDGIPENWFDAQICQHYGFCGQEVVEIRRQIEAGGKAVLVL